MTSIRLHKIYIRLNKAARFLLLAPVFEFVQRLLWKHKIAFQMRQLARIDIQPPARGAGRPPGVNFIGDLGLSTGLGEGARLLLNLIELSSETLALVPVADAAPDPPYDINIVYLQPLSLPSALSRMGSAFLNGRYNIAFWVWELEKYPAEWRPAFRLFNEIWVPSEFVRRSIARETNLPVFTVPHTVASLARPEHTRRYFGLPENCFLVLAAFDYYSYLERKNPAGAIEAFIRAFPRNEARAGDAGLVLKFRNLPLAWRRRFKKMLKGYPHIYFMENTMTKEEVHGLIKNADVFLSPHRAEGFGLVMAEAMYLGTPCVATNWSANTEFMGRETAALLDYTLVDIRRGFGPYPRGGRWAEPDIGQAAAWLRRLYDEPELGAKFSQAAAGRIRTVLNPKIWADRIRQRLERIRLDAP